MERFRTVGAALAGLALLVAFSAAPAVGTHTTAFGFVQILRGGSIVIQHLGDDTSCSSLACSVDVFLPKRDLNRFARWCGASPISVNIAASSNDGRVECFGPSTWVMQVGAAHNDIGGHGDVVVVEVSLQLAP